MDTFHLFQNFLWMVSLIKLIKAADEDDPIRKLFYGGGCLEEYGDNPYKHFKRFRMRNKNKPKYYISPNFDSKDHISSSVTSSNESEDSNSGNDDYIEEYCSLWTNDGVKMVKFRTRISKEKNLSASELNEINPPLKGSKEILDDQIIKDTSLFGYNTKEKTSYSENKQSLETVKNQNFFNYLTSCIYSKICLVYNYMTNFYKVYVLRKGD